MYALDPLILSDDSNNYQISQRCVQPIEFDQQNFNYYLKMLSVGFSLVDPNLFTGINDTLIAKLYNSSTLAYRDIGYVFDEGLYDLPKLVQIFNGLFLKSGEEYYAKLTYNEYQARLSLRIYPDVLNADGFDSVIFSLSANQSFLQNKILGFSQWNGLTQSLTMNSLNSVITALSIPVIQSYNRLILKTNLVKNNTYITDPYNKGLAIRTNALLAFSSVGTAYSYKERYSFSELLFPIDATRIDEIRFSLTGENNEILKVSEGNTTDFNIQAVILVSRKI